MPESASLHAIVRGRVQGVYFRAFVQRHARALGLAGWVRNLPDGRSVEVMAEGDRQGLEQLLCLLHQGPPEARVEQVQVEWGQATGSYQDFKTRY